jgi:hypothetical protein
MTEQVEIIDAIANLIDADSMLSYDYGAEGIFDHVDSIDHASATLIFFGKDDNPYEVRVRRVTEDDCLTDKDGIVPPAVMPHTGNDED